MCLLASSGSTGRAWNSRSVRSKSSTKFQRSSLPVSVDAELMHRALSNLVLNAMDAMPDGGTLTIAAARECGIIFA